MAHYNPAFITRFPCMPHTYCLALRCNDILKISKVGYIIEITFTVNYWDFVLENEILSTSLVNSKTIRKKYFVP